jgi:hypothetical protein
MNYDRGGGGSGGGGGGERGEKEAFSHLLVNKLVSLLVPRASVSACICIYLHPSWYSHIHTLSFPLSLSHTHSVLSISNYYILPSTSIHQSILIITPVESTTTPTSITCTTSVYLHPSIRLSIPLNSHVNIYIYSSTHLLRSSIN